MISNAEFCNEKLNGFVPPGRCDRLSEMCGWNRRPAARRAFPSSVTFTSSKMASASSSPFASVVSPLANVYDRFSQWKAAFGLTNPGTVENLTKEVKCELRLLHHYPHYPVVSARRLISHVPHVGISCNPQLKPPSSYPPDKLLLRRGQGRSREKPLGFTVVPSHPLFLARFTDSTPNVQLRRCVCEQLSSVTIRCHFQRGLTRSQVLLTGNVDNEGNVNGRFNHGWTPASVTKVQAQVRSTVALCKCMLTSHPVEPAGWS